MALLDVPELEPGDLENIKMFNVIIKANLSRRVYEWIQLMFRKELHLESLYKLHRRISKLASVKEVFHDMCVNSCFAFTGESRYLTSCPTCKEPRYDGRGRSRQKFSYLAIEQRLLDLYQDPVMSEKLRYPSTLDFNDDTLWDVHCGSHYQDLRGKHIEIRSPGTEDEILLQRYFEDEHDVAFGIMTDGFSVFKRQRGGTQSCWPIILINFSLPPSERFRLENIIPVALLPGPHAPKDFNSFLRPLIDECKVLARGVCAYDASLTLSGEPVGRFILRAFPISLHGDMPAVKHCTCMKGHNGVRPCRYCEIKGVRDQSKPRAPYYVPLRQPDRPEAPPMSWDPRALPLRTIPRLRAQLKKIEDTRLSKTERKKARQRWGINEKCDLFEELPSLSPTKSLPHEWMHLFLENNGKNLVSLWVGDFKGLALEEEGFRIDKKVWSIIGADTAAAGSMIPSSFGRRTPNISTERHNFTAEDWAFWLIYEAPYLLYDAFPDPRIYDHFMTFNRILKLTTELGISRDEVQTIRELCIEYVEGFERYAISFYAPCSQ